MALRTNFDLTILLHNTHNFCAFDAKLINPKARIEIRSWGFLKIFMVEGL